MSALPCSNSLPWLANGLTSFGLGDGDVGLLLDALVAVGPFDREPFLLEQALVIGDQFRQSLERRGGFQNQLLHECALRVSRVLCNAGNLSLAREAN